jgi:predicted phosphodiesterase
MRVAVISDLHLGVGDRSDSFGHDDWTFLAFLKSLEADFERIILLGDIWETLTLPRFGDPREGLRCAREAHPVLARRFEMPKYHYIHGNHDLVLGQVGGAPSATFLEADGIRLGFTHGHHHDWVIRRARWLSEGCVWLGAWARRIRLSALYRLGRAWDMALSRPAVHPLADSFQLLALEKAKRRSADVMVTGHTHFGLRAEVDGRILLNSGSCTEGNLSYVAIDTKAQVFQLCS